MIIFSLVGGSIVDSCGHSRLMAFGALFMSICIAAFSTAIYIDDNWLIILVGVLLRMGQGKCWEIAFRAASYLLSWLKRACGKKNAYDHTCFS